MQKDALESLLSRMPYLKKPFKYIGLNTKGVPDLVMAYISPQDVMDLIKAYKNQMSNSLDLSLGTMMAVCGGVAVRTYAEDKISRSFGCKDSRNLADIRRENLAVGIPKRLFNVFVD